MADAEEGVRCDERFTTYPELFAHALRASGGLSELGVSAGDRVALLMRNSIEFLEASIATVPLGASAVPINWHWRGEEIAHLLTDSGAKALIVHADLWPEVASRVPGGVATVIVPADGDAGRDDDGPPAPDPTGGQLWPRWLERSPPYAGTVDSAPSSIIYTSGTTGRPKGVVRQPSSDARREVARGLINEIFGLQDGERALIPAPMYHAAPNVYALAAAIQGLDMTILRRFDAEDFLRAVAERQVSVVQMVPTMFVRLLALPEEVRRGYDVSSLRRVVHAAAPCPPHVKRAMIAWLGPIVSEYYGGTETGPIVHCTSAEWLAHPGTVGRPLPGARVRILDERGDEVPTGESGEVYGRLDVWPDFTYHGDEGKRRAAERDGLISIGDVGYVDPEGYLYLNDRRHDMVISGGVNIYPAEIEACLLALHGVRDCAVFGVPDEELGEVLAAHVELAGGASVAADDVREHVRTRLARYKVPRVVEFTATLPREDSGKIFKRRLREPYWAGRERSI